MTVAGPELIGARPPRSYEGHSLSPIEQMRLTIELGAVTARSPSNAHLVVVAIAGPLSPRNAGRTRQAVELPLEQLRTIRREFVHGPGIASARGALLAGRYVPLRHLEDHLVVALHQFDHRPHDDAGGTAVDRGRGG
jgi:hypothetical protein